MPRIQSIRTTQLDASQVPLGIGGSFTSASKRGNCWRYLRGSVFTDQNGTLFIEQDADNMNFKIQDTINIVANVGIGFKIPITSMFIRFRYVNGAVAQTVFRVYAELEP